jgi:hypothetical protein
LTSRLRTWKATLKIVQPDTVLRAAAARHRDLFRWVWARKPQPKEKPGRPPLDKDIVALIKQMTKDNRRWGAKRIVGELAKLGIRVSKPTVRREKPSLGSGSCRPGRPGEHRKVLFRRLCLVGLCLGQGYTSVQSESGESAKASQSVGPLST